VRAATQAGRSAERLSDLVQGSAIAGRGQRFEIALVGAVDPFNPAGARYVTGQGVWATEDAAQADAGQPTHWRFLNRGLEETAVNDLATPPTGPPLYSMVSDLGGFRHDDLDEPIRAGTFQNPIFGSGSSIGSAQSKPGDLVRAGSHDKGQFGAYSANGGKTWQPFASSPKGTTGSGEIVKP
jgi:hypothetical protein